jgi:hypothetical protein
MNAISTVAAVMMQARSVLQDSASTPTNLVLDLIGPLGPLGLLRGGHPRVPVGNGGMLGAGRIFYIR